MKQKYKKSFVVTSCLLLCLCSVKLWADTFKDGIAAFKLEDYKKALHLFLQAEAEGNKSLSLQYNIAVSQFKLGEYEQAKVRFHGLSKADSWRDLATYNLALVELEQKNHSAASLLFTRVKQSAKNAKLRRLAEEKLAKLSLTVVTPPKINTKPSYLVLLKAGIGSDNNIANIPDDLSPTDENSDRSTDFLGYAHHYLRGHQGEGLRLHGMLYKKQYQQVSTLDNDTYGMGITREYKLKFVDFSVAGQMLVNQVDDQRAYVIYGASTDVTKRFSKDIVSLKYFANFYNAATEYQQSDGLQQRVEVALTHYFESMELAIKIGHEQNHRDDLTQEPFFFSYSPTINTIDTLFKWPLTERVKFETQILYAVHDYAGTNHLRDLDGVVKDEGRNADKLLMGVGLSYHFAENWSLKGGYKYTDWNDNFLIYTYNKSQVGLEIEYIYQ